MATFADVVTRMLRIINRPASETALVAEVKASINDAISYLQRNHGYAMTEKVSSFIYPANALQVDLGAICGGVLRDVISIQQISNGGTYEGKPLKIRTYSGIQSLRKKVDEISTVANDELYDASRLGYTIEDRFRQDITIWVMGKSVGAYPRPAQNTTFLIHFHLWLPELAADTDTNFFLDYCQDAVVTIALKRLHLVMKLDSRYAVTQAELTVLEDGLKAWDGQLKSMSNTPIGGS